MTYKFGAIGASLGVMIFIFFMLLDVEPCILSTSYNNTLMVKQECRLPFTLSDVLIMPFTFIGFSLSGFGGYIIGVLIEIKLIKKKSKGVS